MNWDDRTAEQWLDEARRFEKMAGRFDKNSALNASFAALARDARTRAVSRPKADHQCPVNSDWGCIGFRTPTPADARDLDYYRVRALREQTAAKNASHVRARQAHLDMAERYQALISANAKPKTGISLVS